MRRSYPRNHRKHTRSTPFGTLIKAQREAAGLSQTKLAERVGVSRPVLSRLESGEYQQSSPAILTRIALALGIDRADLFAAVGYTLPDQLPHLAPYLRARYPQLPSEAITELQDYFGYICHKFGIADLPNGTWSSDQPHHKN